MLLAFVKFFRVVYSSAETGDPCRILGGRPASLLGGGAVVWRRELVPDLARACTRASGALLPAMLASAAAAEPVPKMLQRLRCSE